jgi:hypothetical protein
MHLRLVLNFSLLLGFAVTSLPTLAQNDMEKGFGLTASDKASFTELGLPSYPGAHEYKESSKDSSAASLGFWAGSTGFKLVVMQFESKDSADKIADFYRKGLSKYGHVLDCSHETTPPQKDAEKKSDKKSQVLTCEDDHAEAGEMLFKSGIKSNQYLVGIKRVDDRTQFQLIHLQSKEAQHFD